MTAPARYDPSAFPPFAVTADTAVLTTRNDRLMIVLIQRSKDPFAGRWALPGGFVGIDEDLQPAATRELEEETGLRLTDVRQFGAYGQPHRDPRMRVVTIVFLTYVEDLPDPRADDDAADARLWVVDDVLDAPHLLAFDHRQIIADVISTHRTSN